MAYLNSSQKLEAIQIIKSVEKNVSSKDKPQIIKLIEQHGNGPPLQEVLCGSNKDLPIFVISICGKTRTGKSFLLNLMIKYLESEEFENWKKGSLPSVFEWKSGTKSVTRGLWICPKVFKRVDQNGKEVGILLVDNQGLFDGEETEGVSVAVSGISTILSHYQIFNLKDSICDNDLESIWRHLISDEDNQSEASKTKLVFAVRDYLNEDKGCGLGHGKAYIEAERKRGSQTHKSMWEGLQKMFPEILCLLLPFPGLQVRKGVVEKMDDIDPYFLENVESFFKTIFDPKSINKTKDISTGQEIYDVLKKFDNKEADETLSFANIFTEQGNQMKLEISMRNLEMRLESFKGNLSEGQSLLEGMLNSAKKTFKGKSSDEYLEELKMLMTDKINLTIQSVTSERYTTALKGSSDATYTHLLEWGIVKTRLQYFIGSEAEKSKLKDKVIVGCAEEFYLKKRTQLVLRFESNCKHKTLTALQGYDEIFVKEEFPENKDFKIHQRDTQRSCYALWLREKEILHFEVQDKYLLYVAALTDVDREWLRSATKAQFKLYETFTWNNSHWIDIKRDDDSLMELVAFTMHKTPKKLSEYSEEKLNVIKLIAEQIKSKSESDMIILTCIFILYVHKEKESCEPVFKVKNYSGCTFIDIKGRTYPTWEAFENKNKLPDCLFCHPSEGEYNKGKGFRVSFSWSPASSFGSKFLSVLDVAGKIVAIASAGALGAAVALPSVTLISIGGAVAAGVSGSWGAIRSGFKIKDKIEHEQGVDALDAVDAVGNLLSVVTAGVTAGAVVLTKLGKEIACAPAIIQGITSLTGLVFQLNGDNLQYLSVANEISMLLFFNNKSIDGAMSKIRTSYSLPPNTSMLDTLKKFISKNSITFPKPDGERLTTDEFLSENWKTLLLTAIMNQSDLRPAKFLNDTFTTSEELRPLQKVFRKTTNSQDQLTFFEEILKSIGEIIRENRKKTHVKSAKYQGFEYHPISEVASELAQAGVCTSLIRVADCPNDESVEQVFSIAKEILKIVNENARTTSLEGLIAYLKENSHEIVEKVLKML